MLLRLGGATSVTACVGLTVLATARFFRLARKFSAASCFLRTHPTTPRPMQITAAATAMTIITTNTPSPSLSGPSAEDDVSAESSAEESSPPGPTEYEGVESIAAGAGPLGRQSGSDRRGCRRAGRRSLSRRRGCRWGHWQAVRRQGGRPGRRSHAGHSYIVEKDAAPVTLWTTRRFQREI